MTNVTLKSLGFYYSFGIFPSYQTLGKRWSEQLSSVRPFTEMKFRSNQSCLILLSESFQSSLVYGQHMGGEGGNLTETRGELMSINVEIYFNQYLKMSSFVSCSVVTTACVPLVFMPER